MATIDGEFLRGAGPVAVLKLLDGNETATIEQTRRDAQHDRRLVRPRAARQIEGTATEEITHGRKTARAT